MTETKSLWDDWLPEFVAALKAVEPTPEEKAGLERARDIQKAWDARVEALMPRPTIHTSPK